MASSSFPWGYSILVAILAFFAISLSGFPRVEYRTYSPHTGSGAIVITGCSSGIGRHAGESLAKRGWIVFCTVRTQKDVDSLNAEGITNLRPVIVDVSDAESRDNGAKSLIAALKEENLPLVALVNNAGVVTTDEPLEFMPINEVERVFDVNVIGAVGMTQLLLPELRKSSGRIVMISSIAGLIRDVPGPPSGAYHATKWALEALANSLRWELKPFGVSVSSVEPGFVKSSIGANAKKVAVSDSEYSKRMKTANKIYKELAAFNKKVDEEVDESLFDGPEVTTTVITHAIESKYPLTRYPCARVKELPVSILWWMSWALPDRLWDFIIFASLSFL
jgi:NAD(P)-dependent dehydrogenase (short-subunit alcohol dehydrogenase family)